MKFNKFWFFLVISSFIMGLIAVGLDNNWLEQISLVFFVVFLFIALSKKLDSPGVNFYGFFLGILFSGLAGLFHELWYASVTSLLSWTAALFFILKEAIKFTEYRRGNRYGLLYFFTIVGLYTYLFFLHILEMEAGMSSNLQLAIYLLYYLNLLILGIIALIYYLNSFSRKAVYFISFALALIFASVLRDMSAFYFRDLSVEMAGAAMKCSALLLSFLFFITREKKLRLLNLV